MFLVWSTFVTEFAGYFAMFVLSSQYDIVSNKYDIRPTRMHTKNKMTWRLTGKIGKDKKKQV